MINDSIILQLRLEARQISVQRLSDKELAKQVVAEAPMAEEDNDDFSALAALFGNN